MCVRESVCVCVRERESVCVCEREKEYMYMYMLYIQCCQKKYTLINTCK